MNFHILRELELLPLYSQKNTVRANNDVKYLQAKGHEPITWLILHEPSCVKEKIIKQLITRMGMILDLPLAEVSASSSTVSEIQSQQRFVAKIVILIGGEWVNQLFEESINTYQTIHTQYGNKIICVSDDPSQMAISKLLLWQLLCRAKVGE